MKTKARLECEKWINLVTQAIRLDLKLSQRYIFNNQSDKIIRIVKKSTKRIERRNQKAGEALNALEMESKNIPIPYEVYKDFEQGQPFEDER